MRASNSHDLFFALVKQALELKSKVTYEDLAALGQAGLARELAAPKQDGAEQAQEYQETYKGAMMRFGKRCLAFVGAPETKMYMLVWNVLGGMLMTVHYRFFKYATWYSHSKEDERISVLDFCPGLSGSSKNPATSCLSDIATVLFEPNSSRGKELLEPLLEMFGASIQWPEQLVRVFMKSHILAFCKIWRQLRH